MFLERRGIPTATVVTHVFHEYAAGLARMQGLRELPLIVLEHPVAAQPAEILRGRIQAACTQLLTALLGHAPREGTERA
jgi:hypothetical protein